MSELVLPSQNETYGFYGQMTACALRDRPTDQIWTVACAFIGLATGARTVDQMRGIRDFLDSSMGRHFADDVIDALHGRAMNNETAIIKTIKNWQTWTISAQTQREEGIPVGLPYLTGWVQQFAVTAAIEGAN